MDAIYNSFYIFNHVPTKVDLKCGYLFAGLTGPNDDPNITLFTSRVGSDILLNQNRPALVVSSTSWYASDNLVSLPLPFT